MIQIEIVPTARNSSKENWTRMSDTERKNFEDLKTCKAYLKNRYGKCKRYPVFIDKENSEALKYGYVFSFRNADYSHAPIQKWFQQDWVTFFELKPLAVR
jgi:hypothetical protein